MSADQYAIYRPTPLVGVVEVAGFRHELLAEMILNPCSMGPLDPVLILQQARVLALKITCQGELGMGQWRKVSGTQV